MRGFLKELQLQQARGVGKGTYVLTVTLGLDTYIVITDPVTPGYAKTFRAEGWKGRGERKDTLYTSEIQDLGLGHEVPAHHLRENPKAASQFVFVFFFLK